MKIELTKIAFKQFSKLPRSEAKKIDRKLHELENDPFSAKKLEGKLKDRYVVRAWPYRTIYVIVRNVKIQVEIIEHRQGVYK